MTAHEDVRSYFLEVGVDWQFNNGGGPWWGGIFERMIHPTKRCLRKTLEQAKLTYTELLTALTEVEAIINSHPLSYVSTDDHKEPLTPYVLIGQRVLSLPDALWCQEETDEDIQVSATCLSHRMKHLNYVLTTFGEDGEMNIYLSYETVITMAMGLLMMVQFQQEISC